VKEKLCLRECVCDVGLCLVEDDTIGLFFNFFFSFLDLDLVIYLVMMRLIKMSLRFF